MLNLGLKFVPNKSTDYAKLKIEAMEFFRKIRLQAHFANNEPPMNNEATGFRNKSKFIPVQNIPKQIYAFEQTVLSSISKLEKNKRFIHRNINSKQQVAIQNLKLDSTVVIKQADKGGAVVVWPTEMYLKEGRSQVNNQMWYRPIKEDPVTLIQDIIAKILQKGVDDGYVGPKELDFLTKKYPRTPIKYFVPKIHKYLEEPPGRPIVFGCDSILEPISKYIDFFLKPFLLSITSYLRDTTDFTTKVENTQFNEQTQLMVTFDVTSLYTQIPQDEALQVMEL